MVVLVAAALALTLSTQSGPADRARAVDLARTGHTADALAIFERIVSASPEDIEAKLWVARLHARLGETARAEGEFRAVLRERPADIDAQIGLASVLLRRNAWREALAMMREAEPRAGENADLFAVLGRAYQRAGESQQALEYYARASTLSPSDTDIRYAYEDAVEAYGSSIAVEGFGEHVSPSSDAGSGAVTAGWRKTSRLVVTGGARVQQRAGDTDFTVGGGIEWRLGPADVVHGRAMGAPGNVSLPVADLSGDLVHYAGAFEWGGAVRRLWFEGAAVVAVSPVFAWDRDRWRTDTRYTFSHSSFDATGKSSGDSSFLARETWRPRWRLELNFAYAYGIESFEDLTADRLGALAGHTIAPGVRIRMRPFTQIFANWEHQWRSNDTVMDRVTLAVVRSFP